MMSQTKQKTEHASPLAKALKELVEEKGVSIYQNDQLASLLKNKQVPLKNIKQLELALEAGSLKNFVANYSQIGLTISQINNMLLSLEETGLSVWDCRQLLTDVLYSLHHPQLLTNINEAIAERRKGTELYHIPSFVYQDELDEYEQNLMGSTKCLTADAFYQLKAYADAGIPKAYYLLGYAYLTGAADGIVKDEALAKKYIDLAETAGYGKAYAIHADICYEKNEYDRAYQLYSMPGAIAMDDERCKNMGVLLKAKKYAKKNVLLPWTLIGILLSVLMLFALETYPLLSILGVALNVLTMVVMFIWNVKRPFWDLRYFGIVYAIILFFFLFMMMI